MAQSQTGRVGSSRYITADDIETTSGSLASAELRDELGGTWYIYPRNSSKTLLIVERRDTRTGDLIRAFVLDGFEGGITDATEFQKISLQLTRESVVCQLKAEEQFQGNCDYDDGEGSTQPQSSSSQTTSTRPTPKSFRKGSNNYPILGPQDPPIGSERTVSEITCSDTPPPLVCPPSNRRKPVIAEDLQQSPLSKVRKIAPKAGTNHTLEAIIRGGAGVRQAPPQLPPQPPPQPAPPPPVLPYSGFGLGRGKCLRILPNGKVADGEQQPLTSPELRVDGNVHIEGLAIPRALLRKIELRLQPDLKMMKANCKYPRLTCPYTLEPTQVRVAKRGLTPWLLTCDFCDSKSHKVQSFMKTPESIYQLIWVIYKVGSLPSGFSVDEFYEVMNDL